MLPEVLRSIAWGTVYCSIAWGMLYCQFQVIGHTYLTKTVLQKGSNATSSTAKIAFYDCDSGSCNVCTHSLRFSSVLIVYDFLTSKAAIWVVYRLLQLNGPHLIHRRFCATYKHDCHCLLISVVHFLVLKLSLVIYHTKSKKSLFKKTCFKENKMWLNWYELYN